MPLVQILHVHADDWIKNFQFTGEAWKNLDYDFIFNTVDSQVKQLVENTHILQILIIVTSCNLTLMCRLISKILKCQKPLIILDLI